ncbi:MAG TPA: CHASE4 domain-containing protein, partial [Rhizobiaceae bacterium]|nr:CHASE4 domain-containing protein [Rhizobiaceae bacterium]
MIDTVSNLATQIRVALSALAALTAAGAIAISIFASLKTDREAILNQQALVRHVLEEQIAAVPRDQQSITVWDDHVVYSRKEDQQWLAENVGEWMYTYFGHERVYILDGRETLIYAMRDGKTIEPPSFDTEHVQLTAIAAQLRQRLTARRLAGD